MEKKMQNEARKLVFCLGYIEVHLLPLILNPPTPYCYIAE